MICAHCKVEVGFNYYTVTRHAQGGNHTETVCSLLCLLNWTGAMLASQGAQLVGGIRHAAGRVGQLLRGKPKP